MLTILWAIGCLISIGSLETSQIPNVVVNVASPEPPASPFDKAEAHPSKVGCAVSTEVEKKPKTVKILEPHEEEKGPEFVPETFEACDDEMLLTNAGLQDIGNLLKPTLHPEQTDQAMAQKKSEKFGESDAEEFEKGAAERSRISGALTAEVESADFEKTNRIKQPHEAVPTDFEADEFKENVDTLKPQQQRIRKKEKVHVDRHRLDQIPEDSELAKKQPLKPQFKSVGAPKL